MRVQPYRIAGEETVTHVLEHEDDVAPFRQWLAERAPTIVGFDTEGTGLNVFARDHEVRLVQFGDTHTAYVARVDRFAGTIREALANPAKRWVAHNATFDALTVARHGLADLATLLPRLVDTRILAHLIDPRTRQEGGAGLRLKELADIFVDPSAPDTAEDLHEVFRKEYGATKKSGLGWRLIDIDHPTYTLYAGLDAILVSRVLRELTALIRATPGQSALAAKEHRLAAILARMEFRGLAVDVPYTTALTSRLHEEAEQHAAVAARYGVANVSSTKQVTEALLAMGEVWTEKTDSGAPAVGKEVLLPMADLDPFWDRNEARTPNPLANAVLRSKRALKWGESYAAAFLSMRDDADRIHPSINGLSARTARMSVSRPPLQQLPSGGWTIRRAIVADPGMLMFASDYSQVEMRVLGGAADVHGIREAVRQSRSIHEFTAEMLFGPDYPKWKYKIAKNAGFSKVFGGGIARLALTSGCSLEVAKGVSTAYDDAFPEIKKFGRRLQIQARHGRSEVVTPAGRHLPLDSQRTYAATNYYVQSTARDILAGALFRIDDAGMSDYLLLPVHDELLGQAPAEDAADVAREIGRLMETTFEGVHIGADPEVYGPSWGSGYGCPPELDAPSPPLRRAA